MNREQSLKLLHEHLPEIYGRFNVKRLILFGSAARDELREDSDIDVLVAFNGPATFDGYMDLKFFLEDLFGRKVDLVTEMAVRPELRPYIEKDAIHVT